MYGYMEEPILIVNHLTTRLQIGHSPVAVVDDLSFSLYRGKTLALVGESGCGKSMTALSLMRILPSPPALPSEGEVLYQGKNGNRFLYNALLHGALKSTNQMDGFLFLRPFFLTFPQQNNEIQEK